MKSLNYDNKLKKITFKELEFTRISTQKVKEIFYDKQQPPKPDNTGFKKLLLELFSEEIESEVLKYSLLFTPKQPAYDGLGFLYLANRTILPIKVEPSNNYKDWHKVITKGSKFLKCDVMDWLVHFGKDSDSSSSEGMSHEYEGKSFGFEDQELYQETGKYLHSNAPKKFNLKKIASEKRAYLKKYLQTDNVGLLSNCEKMDTALSYFREQLNPSTADIERLKSSFLQLTSFELPAQLECLYSFCDGSIEGIERGYYILNSNQLLKEWSSWKSIFDEWTLEELKVHESDQNRTLPMYVTPYWIPFMSDGNGNFIAIDLAPGKKGHVGQIIVFGADENMIKVLADNVIDFFELLQHKDNPLTGHVS